jgi:hypothetical protein
MGDTRLLLILATVLLRKAANRRAICSQATAAARELIGIARLCRCCSASAGAFRRASGLASPQRGRQPADGLLKNPRAMICVCRLFAGGVREEVQRAFILTDSSRDLSGPGVGLVVTSTPSARDMRSGWDGAGRCSARSGGCHLRRRGAIARRW